MKPLLLIDVDGALSADAMGNPAANGYVEHRTPAGLAVLSADISNKILNLSDRYELTWCTGWNDRANEHLCPLLHWPSLPVLDLADARQAYDASRRDGSFVPFPQRTWKLDAVRAYVGDRPVAWLDDQIGHDVTDWAERRDAATLLVWVRANHGISDEQIDTLAAWARDPVHGVTYA